MRRLGRGAAALLVAAAFASARPLAAQQGLATSGAVTGVQIRQYSFDSSTTAPGIARSVRQLAVPLAGSAVLARNLTLDLGTWYAATRVNARGGGSQSLNGFTDTQLGLSYTMGPDALVASVLVTLPTGVRPSRSAQFGIDGAIATSFLSYPVNAYSNGFSVVSGLAAAVPAGGWNLGLAGSVRVNGTWHPFSDDSVFSYRSGLEGRLRAGADRIIGSARLTLGLTLSTFRDDRFESGPASGSYSPGTRLIGEVRLAAPALGGTVNAWAWNYFRSSGSSDTVSTANREDVVSIGAMASLPAGRGLRFEPQFETRFWAPEQGSGRLIGGGAGLRFDLGGRATGTIGGRFDFGTLKTPASESVGFRGWSSSAMLRYSL